MKGLLPRCCLYFHGALKKRTSRFSEHIGTVSGAKEGRPESLHGARHLEDGLAGKLHDALYIRKADSCEWRVYVTLVVAGPFCTKGEWTFDFCATAYCLCS